MNYARMLFVTDQTVSFVENEIEPMKRITPDIPVTTNLMGRSGASEKLHGTVVGHNGKDTTRVFKEVAKLGEALKKMDELIGSTTKAEVVLIFDWENKWAIENLMGLTKPLDYDEICEEHYIPFGEESVSVDIISMEQDFSEYKVVIAPILYSVRPGVADRLKKFTADGGTLILTYCTAYVNGNDLCFLGGFPGDGLMEVAGLEAEEIDALYPEERNEITVISEETGAKVDQAYACSSLCELVCPGEDCISLAVYGKDFYAGKPAVTVHPYGKGQCYYLATRIEGEFLEGFYKKIIEDREISKNLNTPLPKGVTVQRREKDNKIFDFIMNFSEEEQQVILDKNTIYIDLLKQEQIAEEKIILSGFGYRILKHDKCQYE